MQFTKTHALEDILLALARRVRAIELTFDNIAASEAETDGELHDAYAGYSEMSADVADALTDLVKALPVETLRVKPYAEAVRS